MLARLVSAECYHLLHRSRFPVVLALMVLYELRVVVHYKELLAMQQEPGVGGILLISHQTTLVFLVPALVGVLAGDALAGDLCEGRMRLLLVRGVTRGRCILAKAISMGAVSAAAMTLIIASLYIMAAFVLPWKGWVLHPDYEADLFYPGPIPSLFRSNPWVADLLGAVMLIFGSAIFSFIALPIGLIWPNRYVATASPMIVFVLSLALFRDTIAQPYIYLEVWGPAYQQIVPSAFQVFAPFLYWSVIGALLVGVSVILFRRKEIP